MQLLQRLNPIPLHIAIGEIARRCKRQVCSYTVNNKLLLIYDKSGTSSSQKIGQSFKHWQPENMTGKVLDRDTAGILVLILPLALAIVVLYKAWPFLLLLLLFTIFWRIWQNYQWKKWCRQINPLFNQLIIDNQGCLTPMDLSLKANLTGNAASQFLEKKAEEYGAQRKIYEGKGTVYYFMTAGVLGSIFDDSDPLTDEEIEALPPEDTPQIASSFSEPEKKSFSPFSQLKDLKKSREGESETSAKTESGAKTVPQSLIQAELAKRLEIHPSTLGRRKSDEDFSLWSQTKDPEGIAWKYLTDTQLFVPADGD